MRWTTRSRGVTDRRKGFLGPRSWFRVRSLVPRAVCGAKSRKLKAESGEYLTSPDAPVRLTVMKNAILVLSLALAIAVPALAQDAQVAGVWTLTLETPQGTSNPTLTLKQDAQKLTGTYAGRMGEIPIEGTIKDKAISFSAKISAQGQEIVLTFAGTVDQDSMKGTVDFGGMGSADWTGARKK